MSRVGVALDIDGVLVRGSHVLPRAAAAIGLLVREKIPFIFLTNGGGITEAHKATELSSKLNIEIHPRQVLLSHSPIRSLLPLFGNKPMLVLGHDKCFEVAKDYGFKQACNIHALHASQPDAWPRRASSTSYPMVDMTSIAAIVNFHDPLDWALELQIVSDLLVENKHVKYYSCNADITYAGSYFRPRYTQGAFDLCLKELLLKAFNVSFDIHNFGKPFAVQYRYAESMLVEEARLLGLPAPISFIGVGDNPKADIRGANNAGPSWQSVLVRTGIFSSDALNDTEDPADAVVGDVLDAVQLVVAAGGGSDR